MKSGVDAHALAVRLKNADPAARKRIMAAYRAWLLEGARAGQSRTLPGVGLIGLGATLLSFNVLQAHALTLYAAGGLALVLGLFLFSAGARRERAWRAANPFRG
ncbi:MAG: hypothetical protein J7521_11060 [Caulobacter sp.]|nr:hypothetical protein [Caulobacter sp.]